MLLCLLSELYFVESYLQCMLPVVLFITLGGGQGAWRWWIGYHFAVLCNTRLHIHNMIKLPVIRLIQHLYSALPSSHHLNLSGAISWKMLIITLSTFPPQKANLWGRHFPHVFYLPFHLDLPLLLRVATLALENFECPWDVQTSTFLFLCLPNAFQVLLMIK